MAQTGHVKICKYCKMPVEIKNGTWTEYLSDILPTICTDSPYRPPWHEPDLETAS